MVCCAQAVFSALFCVLVNIKAEEETRKCAAQVVEEKEVQDVLADHDRGTEEAEVGREDPRVTSVMERLGQLETRVGSQLDHLVELQQQQVAILSVRMSVWLAVCQSCCLAGCPSVCLSVSVSCYLFTTPCTHCQCPMLTETCLPANG